MNELINVDEVTQTVSARELHERLGIATAFKDWFPRMCDYGFVQNKDYNLLKNERVQIEGSREVKRVILDANISIDMAKQICMIQRTEIGKTIREYFLDLEKAWNTPEQIMSRALKIADQTIASLKNRVSELSDSVIEMGNVIETMKPKVDYCDIILSTTECLTTSQVAQDYGMSAKRFNSMLYTLGVQYKVNSQWLLYTKYLGKGYTKTKVNTYTKTNGENGSKSLTVWTQKGRMFLYELLKDNGVYPTIEVSE